MVCPLTPLSLAVPQQSQQGPGMMLSPGDDGGTPKSWDMVVEVQPPFLPSDRLHVRGDCPMVCPFTSLSLVVAQ